MTGDISILRPAFGPKRIGQKRFVFIHVRGIKLYISVIERDSSLFIIIGLKFISRRLLHHPVFTKCAHAVGAGGCFVIIVGESLRDEILNKSSCQIKFVQSMTAHI